MAKFIHSFVVTDTPDDQIEPAEREIKSFEPLLNYESKKNLRLSIENQISNIIYDNRAVFVECVDVNEFNVIQGVELRGSVNKEPCPKKTKGENGETVYVGYYAHFSEKRKRIKGGGHNYSKGKFSENEAKSRTLDKLIEYNVIKKKFKKMEVALDEYTTLKLKKSRTKTTQEYTVAVYSSYPWGVELNPITYDNVWDEINLADLDCLIVSEIDVNIRDKIQILRDKPSNPILVLDAEKVILIINSKTYGENKKLILDVNDLDLLKVSHTPIHLGCGGRYAQFKINHISKYVHHFVFKKHYGDFQSNLQNNLIDHEDQNKLNCQFKNLYLKNSKENGENRSSREKSRNNRFDNPIDHVAFEARPDRKNANLPKWHATNGNKKVSCERSFEKDDLMERKHKLYEILLNFRIPYMKQNKITTGLVELIPGLTQSTMDEYSVDFIVDAIMERYEQAEQDYIAAQQAATEPANQEESSGSADVHETKTKICETKSELCETKTKLCNTTDEEFTAQHAIIDCIASNTNVH